ncbi:MAG TPA: hypothetical protein ENI85_00050 [Deltaproteobacteria bacterium]|nr:hypothetical protein [Deltaproteobacteria bacterium]
MGTIGVIQARMGSERLPGKILAPLGGRPLLAWLAARIAPARVDEWWLATSSDASDDVTEAWGFELGLRVYRGDPADVLSRFLAIGAESRAEWMLRVTADNPFLDACLIDTLLDARDASSGSKEADAVRLCGGLPYDPRPTDTEQKSGACGRVSRGLEGRTGHSPRLPLGYGVELVRLSALERAAREIPEDQFHHRVHVTSWLSRPAAPPRARYVDVPTPADWPDRPDWRWTVDTYEDLAMARGAFRVFGSEAGTIAYREMVARLDAHPEITGMNRHVTQKKLEEG